MTVRFIGAAVIACCVSLWCLRTLRTTIKEVLTRKQHLGGVDTNDVECHQKSRQDYLDSVVASVFVAFLVVIILILTVSFISFMLA